MGIIRNQSIKNSISFYIGMSIGAVNTVLIFPNVFNDQPEHWGLLSLLSSLCYFNRCFFFFRYPENFYSFLSSNSGKRTVLSFEFDNPLVWLLTLLFRLLVFKRGIIFIIKRKPSFTREFLLHLFACIFY